MRVRPKIGAGNIRFGMLPEQVLAELGRPDERRVENWVGDEDEETEIWSYFGGDVELWFARDTGWRVDVITLRQAEIDGVRPVGMPEEEALRALWLSGVPPVVLDDDFGGAGIRDYSCREYELSLWVSDGAVESVTLFPEYDATGNHPIWPADARESELP